MEFQGLTWKFGADVDTDAIIPARYLNTSDPDELARHCMEDADPEFPNKVKSGDIIVAEKTLAAAVPGSMPLYASRLQEYPVLSLSLLPGFFTGMPLISGCRSWNRLKPLTALTKGTK